MKQCSLFLRNLKKISTPSPNSSFTTTLSFRPSSVPLLHSAPICVRGPVSSRPLWGLGPTQWKGGEPDLKQRVVSTVDVSQILKSERGRQLEFAEREAQRHEQAKQILTPGASRCTDTYHSFPAHLQLFLFQHF